MLEYRFKSNGPCVGSVTGIHYQRTVGAVVLAPKGEFDKLGGGDVEIVKKKTKKAVEQDG